MTSFIVEGHDIHLKMLLSTKSADFAHESTMIELHGNSISECMPPAATTEVIKLS